MAIECAGEGEALNACVDAVPPLGTVMQTGLHIRSAVPQDMGTQGRSIAATGRYGINDWPRVVRPISRGALPVERIVTPRVGSFEIVESGLDRLIDPSSDRVRVLASPAM